MIEPGTFARELQRVVNKNHDRTFAIDARSMKQLSYAEFAELVERFSVLLHDRALGDGDTVMSLMPSSVEQFALFIAALRDGFGFVPLAPQATPEDVKRMAALLKARHCFVSSSLSGELIETMDGIRLDHIAAPMGMDFSWLPDARPNAANEDKTVASGRLYLSTSGTTGEPKAMVIDPERLWASARAFSSKHDFIDQTSRFFNILPMSYLGGLFNLGLIPLASGASTCIDEPFTGRSTLSFWNDVERLEVNTLWLVPTMVHGLLQMAERGSRSESGKKTRTYPKVRASLLGTAPINLDVKERFETLTGIPLVENYALSETTFLSSETLGTRFNRIAGSTGRVLDYVELEIHTSAEAEPVSADGHPAGEVVVRTPYAFLGYLGADGTIDTPFDSNGFLKTGDIGYLDDNQNLVIIGRIKDIIKKGGLMVSLPEIDRAAEDCPGVEAAATIPVKHAFYGEDIALAIVPKPEEGDHEALIARVRSHLMNKLIRYKWPTSIIVVDALPRTPSGKLRRKVLAEQYAAGGTTTPAAAVSAKPLGGAE